MRLFVALEPSGDVRSAIQEVVSELSAVHKNAMWVRPENLHFTLKFLGDVEDSRLGEVIKAIESAVKPFRTSSLHVHGMGYFGSRRRARIVWAGTKEGSEELGRVALALEAGLSSFRREERTFSPHLTICRPSGDTSGLIDEIVKLKEKDFGVMEVKSVVLKKSTLTQQGAIYETVREFIF